MRVIEEGRGKGVDGSGDKRAGFAGRCGLST